MENIFARLTKIIVVLFMVGMLVIVSVPQPVVAAPLVDLVLVPATPTVIVGDSVNVTVEVQAGATGVDGITITMDYDPAYLQFQSWTLPAVNNYEVAMFDTTNITGEADYGRATFSETPPSGTFDFVTITFLTLAVTASTPIDFHRVFPRETVALVVDANGLNTATGANVTINHPPTLTVQLQGGLRPYPEGYQIPLTLKLYDSTTVLTYNNVLTEVPLYTFTTASGNITITDISTANKTVTFEVNEAPDGTYNITISSPHSLITLRNGIVVALDSADMGTLLEGNANDDVQINGADFSMLLNDYLETPGGGEWNNGRSDFDRNGQVTAVDFSLLAQNYSETSPQTVGQ